MMCAAPHPPARARLLLWSVCCMVAWAVCCWWAYRMHGGMGRFWQLGDVDRGSGRSGADIVMPRGATCPLLAERDGQLMMM
jgi:hypothetical protein